MGNSIWDNLKKTAQEFDLIPKDLTPEEQAKRDEQALQVAATGFDELENMVGGIKNELGPGKPQIDASKIEAGIQPRTQFLKVPPNEELVKQLLEAVYNPAIAGPYIRFMKSVVRAMGTGDPESEAYKLALGFMADDNVSAEDLHRRLLAILEAIEKERQTKYAHHQRIEAEKIGGLKSQVKNADAEHASIAEKIKQAELLAEQKIKQIQADLELSTKANRQRQAELLKSKENAQRDLHAAEEELQLVISADEAALNKLTSRFRAERETLVAHSQVESGQINKPNATPKK